MVGSRTRRAQLLKHGSPWTVSNFLSVRFVAFFGLLVDPEHLIVAKQMRSYEQRKRAIVAGWLELNGGPIQGSALGENGQCLHTIGCRASQHDFCSR